MRIPKGCKEEDEAWLKDYEEERRKRLEEVRMYREPEELYTPQPQPETQESLMKKMMQRILEGPPPSIRVIAKFGYSNYDFTVTKPEELEMLHQLINKFINSFKPTNNF